MQPASSTERCDILLIEDSFDDVFFLKRAREKLGLEIHVCHLESCLDGRDYLSAAGQFAHRAGLPPPRLIVSDLKVPKWNGIEFLQWVRSNPSLADIPFVMISSSSLEKDIDAANAAGASAYFVKPRTLPGFVHLLSELLTYWKPERRAAASPEAS